MKAMTHKGYTTCIEFDDRDNLLIGRLLGIHDIVPLHAGTVGSKCAQGSHSRLMLLPNKSTPSLIQ